MRKFSKKTVALVVSIVLLLCISIGTTLAYLTDVSDTVVNKFTPSAVNTQILESFDGTTKSDVSVKNTGDIDADIRAAIVVTWQDADGNVYGKMPVAGTDYTMELDLENGWSEAADGFYYWNASVAPGESTGVLITSCTAANTAPEGYSLCVEIIGSGIQSVGIPADKHPWFN